MVLPRKRYLIKYTRKHMTKPFIKWVGGKTNLLPEILDRLPPHINNYTEVFLGGGSVFYELHDKNLITGPILLNDYNSKLITTYQQVRDNTEALNKELYMRKILHDKDHYYRERSAFNSATDPLDIAAGFIYLNKTCFNGLYRVNAAGDFNVPVGRYKEPKIYDPEVLEDAAKALKEVQLTSASFFEVPIKEDTFYYLDPPYHDTFTGYTDMKFSEMFQKDLAEYCRKIDKAGSYFMLSNSLNSFIEDLYLEFNQHVVKAGRSVSSKATNRGKVNELLITNY